MSNYRNFTDKLLPHAFVCSQEEGNYGHIRILIRNLLGNEYWNSHADLLITNQVGSGEWKANDPIADADRKSYAWNFGFSPENETMSLPDLEASVKIMRKIDKKWKQMQDEMGYPTTYGEYVIRLLIASGVQAVFVNDGKNRWDLGRDDYPMYEVKVDGRRIRSIIEDTEAAMIERLCRKS